MLFNSQIHRSNTRENPPSSVEIFLNYANQGLRREKQNKSAKIKPPVPPVIYSDAYPTVVSGQMRP